MKISDLTSQKLLRITIWHFLLIKEGLNCHNQAFERLAASIWVIDYQYQQAIEKKNSCDPQ